MPVFLPSACMCVVFSCYIFFQLSKILDSKISFGQPFNKFILISKFMHLFCCKVLIIMDCLDNLILLYENFGLLIFISNFKSEL